MMAKFCLPLAGWEMPGPGEPSSWARTHPIGVSALPAAAEGSALKKNAFLETFPEAVVGKTSICCGSIQSSVGNLHLHRSFFSVVIAGKKKKKKKLILFSLACPCSKSVFS